VHHCNGTQQSFYDRDDVLVVSSHRYPFYPGTGALDEMGEGPGRGYTVNLPLPAGVGDDVVLEMFGQLLPPIAEAFAPQIVLVSAGYDAHRMDPLGGLLMTEDGYRSLCLLLVEIADRCADGRLGMFLEGGYDLDALAKSTRASLGAAAGEPIEPIRIAADDRVQAFVDRLRDAHQVHWPCLAR
jgi:acetoin utilization deacetylase AcuC-like enzyme